jgi:hypothetical protein
MYLKGQCPPTAPPDCLTDIDMHATMQHCLAHGDESLPHRLAPVAAPDFMVWQLTIGENLLDRMVVHARARGFGGGCRQAASKIVGARPIHTFHGSSTRMGNITALCGMGPRSSMSGHSTHPRRQVGSLSGWPNGCAASSIRRWRSGRPRARARRFGRPSPPHKTKGTRRNGCLSTTGIPGRRIDRRTRS